MKRTSLPARFQDLLARIPYTTIATVSPNGQPWNSPVVGRFDADLNLYWVSWKENQHSRNVATNPRIFVVVYDTHAPEGTGEGLYLQMKAEALTSKAAILEATKTYKTDFFKDPAKHPKFLGDCPQRIYKAVPEHIWYNIDGQEQGHFVDMRAPLT